MDICMAFGGYLGLGHQHRLWLSLDHKPRHSPRQQGGSRCHQALRWQHKPLRSACLPTSSMALRYPHGLQWPPSPDVYLAFGCNLGHRTNTDPSCSRTVDPDMALSGSQGQDLTMASSHLPVSHCLSLQCHFSPQCTNTLVLLFLPPLPAHILLFLSIVYP